MQIHRFLKISLYTFVLCFFACNSDTAISGSKGDAVFQLVSSSHSNIVFNNKVVDQPEANIMNYDYFYNGGGVAIGDINNDGLPDILFTGNLVNNKLYLNKGDLIFEDITEKAGIADPGLWSTGVNMQDINNDGWLDIYICHAGPRQTYKNKQNHLYINNQDGTFTESAQAYGLVDQCFSSQSAFIDYDLDGDLDLFLMNHNVFKNVFNTLNGKKVSNRASLDMIETFLGNGKRVEVFRNILFENNGNGFVRNNLGENTSRWGHGLGLAIADLNKDNKPDIYVANDYEIPDFAYYNMGDGSFEDLNNEKFGQNSFFSMGCDAQDLNNDAWPDLVVADMTSADRVRNKTLMPGMKVNFFKHLKEDRNFQDQYMFNAMQVNNGNGTFSNIGQITNTGQTDWSWSALLADFDMDGDKDYLITNGFKRDTRNRDLRSNVDKLQGTMIEKIATFPSVPLTNFVFENKASYVFEDVSKEWGFNELSFSNGAAYSDLDLDGDLDLVMNNIDQEAFLYRNTTMEKNPKSYLKINFDKDPNNLNAKVTIYHKDKKQYQEHHTIRGYWSSMDPVMFFGLENDDIVDSIRIDWLNNATKLYTNVEVNKTLEVSFSDAQKVQRSNYLAVKKTFFNELDLDANLQAYKHQENSHSEFDLETLLPHSQSNNGPHISVGDVNGDQLDDFYIGGASGQEGVLYVQKNQGNFVESKQSAFAQHIKSEDIGSLFFDYDGDNDLDLYVVSGGGSEFSPNEETLMDRLYQNDGRGNFKFVQDVFNEKIYSSGSAVKAHDFDEDGDLDLFVGGRLIPGNYPASPKSTLWENKGGKFEDITSQKAPELEMVGLVSDFEWTDFNQDGKMDLIVVGEWMNIEFFEQQNDGFVKATDKYLSEETRAWWFSIKAADMDNDGDTDYIVGNLGLNNKFHASKKKPFEIYYNDFDDNGKNDIVLAKMDEGKQYLMRGKDCSSEQMPFIKDKFPKYEGFANATIVEVLSEEKLNESLHYSIKDFSSIYLENDNGSFKIKPLPIEAQFAPIQDILIDDVNKDNHLDIILAGNLHGAEIETPSYDAGTGYLLLGDGKNNFTTVSCSESGIYLPNDVRELNWININGKKHFIVGSNNDKLKIYSNNSL